MICHYCGLNVKPDHCCTLRNCPRVPKYEEMGMTADPADGPYVTNTRRAGESEQQQIQRLDRQLQQKRNEEYLRQNAERSQLLNERGSTHGDFGENGKIMQRLKQSLREHPGWQNLTPWQREALEMIQHKIGRILCGNPNFYDHWRDIAGYAKLCEERCPPPTPPFDETIRRNNG